ncbi:unnamed protein product [Linum tenue]|uniref:Uncharacterized protein n=1 Tax=Linum tenue TaxID=586396 RepID=A0AAV0H1A4_9ROSI|nr:unnamed protein product [Linum tenue]
MQDLVDNWWNYSHNILTLVAGYHQSLSGFQLIEEADVLTCTVLDLVVQGPKKDCK